MVAVHPVLINFIHRKRFR